MFERNKLSPPFSALKTKMICLSETQALQLRGPPMTITEKD
jgi:hypothetical protein